MNKSEIFKAAWTVAKATRAEFETVRAAFGAALRKVYADRKAPAFVAPIIHGEIRGGGSGGGAWVARIVGPHDKFGLDRQFVQKQGHVSRSGRSGAFHWTLDEPGIYELRGVQYGRGDATIGQLDSGFVRVDPRGEMSRITKAEAIAAAASM